MRRNKRKKDVLRPTSAQFIICLGPPVIMTLISAIIPIGIAGYISLFNWGGGINNIFVGLGNYVHTLKDYNFWAAAWQTLVITALNLIGQVGFGFVIAFLLSSKMTRLKTFHRRTVFFPVILSSFVVGIMWKIIYNTRYGLLNTALRALSLDSLIIRWLAEPSSILFFISLPVIWEYVGMYAVMLMGALSSVPTELIEVAELDGAIGVKKAIYVVIPYIYKTVVACITICFAGTLRIFDQIVAMTNGGPGTSTTTLALYSYQTSFNFYKMGAGSASAILMLLLIGVSTLIFNLVLRGDRFE